MDDKKILKINQDAAEFYRDCLAGPEGEKARGFLNSRGISPAMIERFKIGFAPDKPCALCFAMKDKGWTRMDVVGTSLAVRELMGGGFYDKFRNRVIFPIDDMNGNTIGFIGRSLEDNNPVFLSSPDTLVLNKARDVFALNLARSTKKERVILVEGVMDVITLHQAGFDEAVAVFGNKLTVEHAKLMASCTRNVVVVYDSDDAGQAEAKRAVPILADAGMNVKVIYLEGFRDPEEYVKTKGAEAFSRLIDSDARSEE